MDTYKTAQLDLARIAVADHNSLRQALQEVSRVTASTMHIGRISIWMFLPHRQAIRCEYLYQPDQPDAFEGTLLHNQHFTHYFKALQLTQTVPIADTSNPAILQEFLECYMKPLHITAMLDAPIYRGNQIIGIVCHEQVSATGDSREWEAQDTQLAAFTASTVARLYEEAAKQQAELMLSTHQSHAQTLDRIASIGHMAAGAAHDFKNILHGILAYADMISEAAANSPDVQQLVAKQIQAVEHGSRLAQELLSLGKQETSQPRVINPAETVRQYLPTLQKAAGMRNTVIPELIDEVSQVFIDPNQLERVLLNLTLNAKDAMHGGGKISILVYEAHRSSLTGDNGLYVTVEVIDTGTGMSDTTLENLFQPYFTTKGDKGTGLGMVVIQQIVTMAGGFIDIDSKPGNGTHMRVRLPRIGNAIQ